jgi:general L-amino acid transport system permease protein
VDEGRHPLCPADPLINAVRLVPGPPGNPNYLLSALFDRRVRSWLIQLGLLACVALAATTVVHNTLANMRARDIASGFGFLKATAGFDVAMSLVPYDATSSYARVLLVGALNTLLVSGLGILSATMLGVALGVLRLSRSWLVAHLVAVYVEGARNVPLLLQIIFWYAVTLALPKVRESLVLWGGIVLNNRGVYLPRAIGTQAAAITFAALGLGAALTIALAIWAKRRKERTGRRAPVLPLSLLLMLGLPAAAIIIFGAPCSFEAPHFARFNYEGGVRLVTSLAALWFALTLYTAAFIAEIVRAGIQSVAKGQREAASALGLKEGVILRRIVLPQAMRVIVPPLTSQYLNLMKNSSLAVAIGYPDIVQVFMGTTLNQTGQAVEVIAITMGFYLALSLLISLAMNLYNRRVALKGT